MLLHQLQSLELILQAAETAHPPRLEVESKRKPLETQAAGWSVKVFAQRG